MKVKSRGSMVVRLCLLICIVSIYAVAQADQVAWRDEVEILRSKIQSDKVSAISEAMQLTEEGSVVFWPLYREYEARCEKMGDARVSLLNEYSAAFSTMDNVTAQKLLERSIAWRRKRAKMLHDFVEVLEQKMSPVVAARFYQVERYLTLVIDLKVANQIPLIQYGVVPQPADG